MKNFKNVFLYFNFFTSQGTPLGRDKGTPLVAEGRQWYHHKMLLKTFPMNADVSMFRQS
jgi:hypothetical protein